VQKGTYVHSGIRGVLICLFLVGGTAASSRLNALERGPVWTDARGGAREPGGWYWHNCGTTGDRCIAFVTACSQPYMIEDCYRSFASLGYRSERHALWFDWSLLRHPLLREDTFSLVFGARILDGSWILTMRPQLHRMAVRGFPHQLEYSCGYSCSFMHGRVIGIGIEGYTVRSGDSGLGDVTGAISMRIGALHIVINTIPGSARARAGVIGMELDAGNGLVLLSGYNTGTDEISAGILYRARRCLIGASWSGHESLGTTLSFGVGRLWRR